MVQATSRKISEWPLVTQPSAVMYFPVTTASSADGSGGTTYRLKRQDLIGGVYDIREQGAVSGSVDSNGVALTTAALAARGVTNTAALQAQVNAASAAGGGVVWIPAGTWYFQHGLLDVNVVCQLNAVSKVKIQGAGVGATKLVLVNNADANFFNLTGAASYVTICDMEMDGNRANQTPNIVHGVRADAFSGLWLENLYIHDISHYGIGIEGFSQQYLFFSNIKLENLGGDGFDQKNKSDVNMFQCANNVTVTEFGLAGTTQAGWDCRGAWQIANLVVHFSSTTGSGVRFRNGETGTSAAGGFGGHRTHVTGLEVYGPGAVSSSTGIEAVARDCVVEGAYIRDVLFGVSASFDTPTGFGCSRSQFKGVTVENYGTAGFITSSGADDNDFENCTANGNAVGTYGFRIRSSRNRLLSPRALNNVTTDISLDTGATYTQIENPVLVGTGSPGAAVTGLDVAAADCKLIGGDITGHVTNISVSGVRFTAIGGTARSATTDNVLVAVGGDDATFIGFRARSAAAEGFQTRAARTTILGGESTSNSGNGFQSEATASDCQVLDTYFSGNTADFDDQGTSTQFRRPGLAGSLLNQAVASGGTSSNIDIPLLAGTTVLYRIEAVMEDSTGGTGLRCTQRTLVECVREGSGAPVINTAASEFTSGSGLTVNTSASANNLRVNVTKAASGTSCRMDIRVWEVRRMKTVVFS